MKPFSRVLACLSLLVASSAPALADPDHWHYPGYHERPYDERRSYHYHDHDDRRYIYRGHWRSWEDWERYYHAHPRLHRYGHYYRSDGHLMFGYCDPDDGGCFFFSIGH